MRQSYAGNVVDLVHKRIFPGIVLVENGEVAEITETNETYTNYILPGFIDSHIHLESTMLAPIEFAKIAVTHGTVGVITDAHEIANVMGVKGVEYMIEQARPVPFHIFHSAPSCVPATVFETAGGKIGVEETEYLFNTYPEVKILGEVMNYPGVIAGDPELLEKIALAIKYGKVVDGHSPSVTGEDLKKYVAAGIQTDHECTTLAEAREKAELGMFILMREGSAVKNFDDLLPLLAEKPDQCAFCSDDKHPDDLIEGHINQLVARAAQKGYDLFAVLRASSYVPITLHNLPVGLLQKEDSADFIIINDINSFAVQKTIIKGVEVYSEGRVAIPEIPISPINYFVATPKQESDFAILHNKQEYDVIGIIDRQLLTKHLKFSMNNSSGNVANDLKRDVLKITIVNRYLDTAPAVGFIQGFGLKDGAVASSVAHDSHNIVAIGTNDRDLALAVNKIIEHKGGIAFVSEENGINEILPLEIAGLVSTKPGKEVATRYNHINQLIKQHGSALTSPLMTLSFMALLVIPDLKMSDKGLFDGKTFSLLP